MAPLLEKTAGLVTLLSHRVDASMLERMPALEVVANYAVGYDNIDVSAAALRGVCVTNTPDVLTDATADLTWAALLAACRRVVEGDRMTRAGKFSGWQPDLLLGVELSGKTLGIIGMGAIGKAVARRAAGFDMNVIFAERPSLPQTVDLGLLKARAVSVDELLRTSDVVSLHAPLTEQTHQLLDRQRLELLKPDAVLVNTARGAIVDEQALVERLQKKALRAAAFDVYQYEPRLTEGLVALDNVILLPHIGSATERARRKMAELAFENAENVLCGKPPITAVSR
jgi:glyoxylate reductase